MGLKQYHSDTPLPEFTHSRSTKKYQNINIEYQSRSKLSVNNERRCSTMAHAMENKSIHRHPWRSCIHAPMAPLEVNG